MSRVRGHRRVDGRSHRVGDGVFRRAHRQRLEPRHDGAAVRDPAARSRRRGGRRHRLDPRRHLPAHDRQVVGPGTFTKSGTSDTNRIKFWAFPGELPVFDFSQPADLDDRRHRRLLRDRQLAALQGARGRERADARRSSNNGIWNVGAPTAPPPTTSSRTLNIHHITGPGLSIGNGKACGGHLVLNFDSHDNYDPNSSQGDGQNADGFGHHYQKSGPCTISAAAAPGGTPTTATT